MNKRIRCDCGHEVHSPDTDDLVERARMHAREQHHMELTAAHVLAMAEPWEEADDRGCKTAEKGGTGHA